MSSVTAAPTYQFSVEEYHKLGEAGIFHEDDRVELLNGDIVIMAPIGIRHIKSVRRLIRVLSQHFADRCILDVQNPVMIDGRSEPQPDILLLRPEADTRDTSPLPEDVLLLVEVADSSLMYDKSDKRYPVLYMHDGQKLFDTFTESRRIRREIIDAGQDTAAANFGRDKPKP